MNDVYQIIVKNENGEDVVWWQKGYSCYTWQFMLDMVGDREVEIVYN